MTKIDWKYPSRDGWPPEEEKEYLVSLDPKFFGPPPVRSLKWRLQYSGSDYSFYAHNIIAWAEMPEPAKELDS